MSECNDRLVTEYVTDCTPEVVLIGVLDSISDVDSWLQEIEGVIEQQDELILDFRSAELGFSHVQDLTSALARRFDSKTVQVRFSSSVFAALERATDGSIRPQNLNPQTETNREFSGAAVESRLASLQAARGQRVSQVHGSLRSGRVVQFDGDLVLFGDVKPGAKVVATGSVFVLGVIKGAVHAGSEGNADAVIFSLGHSSAQLQIGGRGQQLFDAEPSSVPSIACVRNNYITLEPYSGRVPR